MSKHLEIINGHWLTEDFKYKEKILDFTELYGIHSGENLTAAVEALVELHLESRLKAITGNNASNNEAMARELHESPKKRLAKATTVLDSGRWLEPMERFVAAALRLDCPHPPAEVFSRLCPPLLGSPSHPPVTRAAVLTSRCREEDETEDRVCA